VRCASESCRMRKQHSRGGAHLRLRVAARALGEGLHDAPDLVMGRAQARALADCLQVDDEKVAGGVVGRGGAVAARPAVACRQAFSPSPNSRSQLFL
jgi:hypothetical protein